MNNRPYISIGYPIEQYKEFNDLGAYFAYIRHELCVREWSALAQKSEFQAFSDLTESIRNKMDLSQLAEVARLDGAIYRVVQGGNISSLHNKLKYYEGLLETDFWVSWTDYTRQLLDLLLKAPKILLDEHVRSDLHYVYNEQFIRLTQRIGIKEFASIIGWSQRQLAAFRSNGSKFPAPVEMLGATPIWTIGQAEDFLRVLNARKVLKIRGDWTSMQEQKMNWMFDWQEVNLECENVEDTDPSERVYWIDDNASSYSYTVNHNIDELDFAEELETVGNFYSKRLRYSPETFYYIAMKYQEKGLFERAEHYLTMAREQFESVVSPEMEGYLQDDNEEYFFTYYFLAFHYANKGLFDKAKNQLLYAQSRLNIDEGPETNFEEEIECLDRTPEKYAVFIREKREFYLPDESPAPQLPDLPGRTIENEEEKKKLLSQYFRQLGSFNGIELFNGIVRYEVNYAPVFYQNQTLSLNTREFPANEALLKEIWIDNKQLLMVSHESRPKNIYLFGVNIEEAKKLAMDWRPDLAEQTA